MKVLVVLTQPPLPDGGAPGKCAIGLLRGLMSHGVDVKAIAARQQWAVPGEPPSDLPLEVVDVAPRTLSRLEREVIRLRRPFGDVATEGFRERIRDAGTGADVLHLEQTEATWCGEGMLLPTAVHMHYLVRRDRRLGAPWSRGFRDSVEAILAERVTVRRNRYLIASSPSIARELARRASSADVVHSPLSLDLRYYDPAPLGEPVAGIIGTATWAPTALAIRRLVDRVWPRVKRSSPRARLVIAGRGTDELVGVKSEGVEVLGSVGSAAAFLRSLSVMIYPATRGSGMKVKVMEALASGVPVVTTPSGAEGIPDNDGIIVRDDDDGLAEAALRLLENTADRKARGTAARRMFAAELSPHAAVQPLLALYDRMASEGSKPAP